MGITSTPIPKRLKSLGKDPKTPGDGLSPVRAVGETSTLGNSSNKSQSTPGATPIPGRGKALEKTNPNTPGDESEEENSTPEKSTSKSQTSINNTTKDKPKRKKSKLNYTKSSKAATTKKRRFRPGTKALKE